MAKRRIERLNLGDEIVAKLRKNGVETSRDLLSKSPLELMYLADIGIHEADILLQQASSKIIHHETIFSLLQRRNMTANYLPTGIQRLDPILCGGLILGTISEVCGPPGIGKTQFCMCCCASALIHSTPGSASAVSSTAAVGGGVLYFDTELKFSIDRLIEIISHQMPSRYNSEWAVDAPHRVQDLLKNLHLRRPVTCSELLHSIENIEDYVIEHRISLIVIDSIASLAKKEGLNEQDKETYILRQSSLLKRISDICSCAILVTNQIAPHLPATAPMTDIYHEVIVDSKSGLFKPALGQIWHHCITTRFVLHHSRASSISSSIASTTQQQHVSVIDVVKSPIVPIYRDQILFQIEKAGLVMIS